MATAEFGKAFAAARAKQGGNGVFTYKGKLYNTRTKEDNDYMATVKDQPVATGANAELRINTAKAQQAQQQQAAATLASQKRAGANFDSKIENMQGANQFAQDVAAGADQKADAMTIRRVGTPKPVGGLTKVTAAIQNNRNLSNVMNSDMVIDQRGKASELDYTMPKKKKRMMAGGEAPKSSSMSVIAANIKAAKGK